MRLIHLADLHIGKQFYGHSLLPDQRDVLRQIAEIAQNQKADAVLISGDVYQRQTPSPEAMSVFGDFLTQLHSCGMPVYIISGNHDSPERVSYLSQLTAFCKIFIAGNEPEGIKTYEMQDSFGTVYFHLMPYCTPFLARRAFPEEAEQIKTYEDAVRAVLARCPLRDGSARHVLLAHQYLTGAQTCESEELAIGGMDNIPASLFADFDYVALGHLHGPQQVTRSTIRYAGSPLRYSFSELRQNKCVTVVDLLEKGNVQVASVPLKPLHGMQDLTGSFESLMQAAPSDDFTRITLTDDCPPPDAARRLRTVFRNLTVISVQNGKLREDRSVSFSGDTVPDDFMGLLDAFYTEQNNGTAMSVQVREIARRLLEETDREVTAP